jgi:hypothetical protein
LYHQLPQGYSRGKLGRALTFTDGDCSNLPATFSINFDITDAAGGGSTSAPNRASAAPTSAA